MAATHVTPLASAGCCFPVAPAAHLIKAPLKLQLVASDTQWEGNPGFRTRVINTAILYSERERRGDKREWEERKISIAPLEPQRQMERWTLAAHGIRRKSQQAARRKDWENEGRAFVKGEKKGQVKAEGGRHFRTVLFLFWGDFAIKNLGRNTLGLSLKN